LLKNVREEINKMNYDLEAIKIIHKKDPGKNSRVFIIYSLFIKNYSSLIITIVLYLIPSKDICSLLEKQKFLLHFLQMSILVSSFLNQLCH